MTIPPLDPALIPPTTTPTPQTVTAPAYVETPATPTAEVPVTVSVEEPAAVVDHDPVMGDLTKYVHVIVQFKGLDDDITDADSAALAANMLREKFRAMDYVMDTDPVPTAPQPVSLNATRDGWRDFETGLGALDGHVIEWTATGHPAEKDPSPLTGGQVVAPGVYVVGVPAHVTANGGPVRVRHGLSGPVTVKAFADEAATTGIGYHFTQPLTDDEEHMELVPGTRVLNVILDPVEV